MFKLIEISAKIHHPQKLMLKFEYYEPKVVNIWQRSRIEGILEVPAPKSGIWMNG